jgi:hypothetical protein
LKAAGDIEAAARFAIRKALPMESIPIDVQRTMKQLNPSIPFVEPPVIEEDWETGQVRVVPAQEWAEEPGTNPSEVVMVAINSSNNDHDTLADNNNSGNDVTGTGKKPCLNSLYEMPDDVKIQFCDNAEAIDLLVIRIKGLASRGPRKLISGFDSEWKPILPTRKGVALLQIGFLNEVYLIDVHKMKGNINKEAARYVEIRDEYFRNEVRFCNFFHKRKLISLQFFDCRELLNWDFQPSAIFKN